VATPTNNLNQLNKKIASRCRADFSDVRQPGWSHIWHTTEGRLGEALLEKFCLKWFLLFLKRELEDLRWEVFAVTTSVEEEWASMRLRYCSWPINMSCNSAKDKAVSLVRMGATISLNSEPSSLSTYNVKSSSETGASIRESSSVVALTAWRNSYTVREPLCIRVRSSFNCIILARDLLANKRARCCQASWLVVVIAIRDITASEIEAKIAFSNNWSCLFQCAWSATTEAEECALGVGGHWRVPSRYFIRSYPMRMVRKFALQEG